MRSLNAELQAQVRGLLAAGEYRGARDIVRALTDHVGESGPSLALADALVELGRREEDLGEHALAADAYRRAELVAATLLGGDPVLAIALGRHAAVMSFLGSPTEAGPLAERAIVRAEAALLNDAPALVEVLACVALVRDDAGDSAAMAHLDRAMSMAATVEDAALRAEALAAAWQAVGFVHRTRGNLGESEMALRTALALAESAFGPQSPEVAGILNDLGMTSSTRAASRKARPSIGAPWPSWSESAARSIPISPRCSTTSVASPTRVGTSQPRTTPRATASRRTTTRRSSRTSRRPPDRETILVAEKGQSISTSGPNP
jgi:Tetratricopeptide repeat